MTAALRAIVDRFDPTVPVERAWLPPSDWYTDPRFSALDTTAVLGRHWHCVGPAALMAQPGAYVCGDVFDIAYVVVRGDDGELRGFHNVCSHHAARLVDATGCAASIKCPYHGWTYGLDGRLVFAPRLAGIAAFDRARHGLRALPVCTWGPLVFVFLGPGTAPPPPSPDLLARADLTGWRDLHFHSRRIFEVACNWKVFIDNYLDGGYHIPTAHPGLDAELEPAAYRTTLHDGYALQTSAGRPAADGASTRVGSDAFYAWLHPTLCINRYGDTLDINVIEPTGPDTMRVVFDFFFAAPPDALDPAQLAAALAQSVKIQDEDAWLCARVQRGKRSPAYDRGRYVPRVEHGEHLFHRLLHADYSASLAASADAGA